MICRANSFLHQVDDEQTSCYSGDQSGRWSSVRHPVIVSASNELIEGLLLMRPEAVRIGPGGPLSSGWRLTDGRRFECGQLTEKSRPSANTNKRSEAGASSSLVSRNKRRRRKSRPSGWINGWMDISTGEITYSQIPCYSTSTSHGSYNTIDVKHQTATL